VLEGEQSGVGDNWAGGGCYDYGFGDWLEVRAEMHQGFQHEDFALRRLDTDVTE
jgi:hypothetical protein